jgi:2-polyprenyl-6-hydroxyphenyl methylase/3-demethylubiquinone-9 3-methyltransferase
MYLIASIIKERSLKVTYYESWYDRLGEDWLAKAPQAILADIPMRVNYVKQVLGVALPSAKLLDLGGGGVGLMAEELTKAGASVTVIDKHTHTLELAKAHAYQQGLTQLSFQVGDFGQLPFPAESFDAVYAYGVLEHAGPLLAQWLREAKRVLKPGGYFIYNLINRSRGAKLLFLTLHAKILKIDPAGHHVFEWFIQPAEMQAALARENLSHREQVGLMSVKAKPLALLNALTHQGVVGPYKFGPDLSVVYMGHATS